MSTNRKMIDDYLVKRVVVEKGIERLKRLIARHVHSADIKGVLFSPIDAEMEEYGLEWELVLTRNISEDIEDGYDEDELSSPSPLLGVRFFLDEGTPSIGIFLRWNSNYQKAAWRELNRMEIFFGGEVRQLNQGQKKKWCLDIESIPFLDMEMVPLAKEIVCIATKIDLILDDDLYDADELAGEIDIVSSAQGSNDDSDGDEAWDE